VNELRPLTFAEADRWTTMPDHVRAASALRRWGRGWVVLQDDVNAIVILDSEGIPNRRLLLPPGADGARVFGASTGNKSHKMDLEALASLPDGRLVAFGSGSTGARETIVIVRDDGTLTLQDGAELYRMLRAETAFSGSELNIEGATTSATHIHLVQRGNGAARGGQEPVNAIGDFELKAFTAWLDGGPLPAMTRVRAFELGTIGAARLGFTDAAALPDGRIAFIACAEASPDTYHDGEVSGARVGIIDDESLRMTDIRDDAGLPSRLKFEGLDLLGANAAGVLTFAVVADLDDEDVPSLFGVLRLIEDVISKQSDDFSENPRPAPSPPCQ